MELIAYTEACCVVKRTQSITRQKLLYTSTEYSNTFEVLSAG